MLHEEVARCQECHTPKTDAGDFDTAKMLKGTKLNVAPIATVAKNPRGGKAGAPMPAYVMKHEDADAIVAYLKSLP
jgi:mono/diheme cytochrome c family protein